MSGPPLRKDGPGRPSHQNQLAVLERRQIMLAAVADHQGSASTTAEIARRYGVSPATISIWVRKSGGVLRSRGRRPAEAPTEKHRAILEEIRHRTYQDVARIHGLTRQRIHAIVKRWRPLVGARKALNVERLTWHESDRGSRTTRTHVISFRLSDPEVRGLLEQSLNGKSVNQLAREIVLNRIST